MNNMTRYAWRSTFLFFLSFCFFIRVLMRLFPNIPSESIIPPVTKKVDKIVIATAYDLSRLYVPERKGIEIDAISNPTQTSAITKYPSSFFKSLSYLKFDPANTYFIYWNIEEKIPTPISKNVNQVKTNSNLCGIPFSRMAFPRTACVANPLDSPIKKLFKFINTFSKNATPELNAVPVAWEYQRKIVTKNKIVKAGLAIFFSLHFRDDIPNAIKVIRIMKKNIYVVE